MIHYGITTLHEIAFNSLMPRISPVNTTECAREILRRVDEPSASNHQDFFKSLLSSTKEMGIIISNEILSEWEMFALLPVSKKLVTTDKYLFRIESGNPKICLYAMLTGHTIHAMMDHIGQTIAVHKSETFRQYVILQNLTKLETVIGKPYSYYPQNTDDDLFIIRILKLGCLIAYITLQLKYRKFFDSKKLNLSAYDINSVMASIQMQDSQLKQIILSLLPRYKDLYPKNPVRKAETPKSHKKPDDSINAELLAERLKSETPTSISEPNGKPNGNNDSISGLTHIENKVVGNIEQVGTFLGSAKVKEILGIKSNTTLMKYRNIGKLSFSRVTAKKIVYKESDVLRLLETGK